MLQFILGVAVGGLVGFGVCAMLCINNSGTEQIPPTSADKEKEEENGSNT